MRGNSVKSLLLVFLILALALSNGIMVLGQAVDYGNSWAKNEIDYMREKEILVGYPDRTFKPNNKMSKAEFYKVINGLIGYTEKSENEFTDVNSTDWYYEEVQKGLKAKYIVPNTVLNADENITRGEVSRIVSFAFDVEEDVSESEVFVDSLNFPEELRGVIGGLKKNGFINGFPDGTFKPEAEITRAEVVKMLSNISGDIINTPITFSENANSNIIVNTPGVVLKDMIIEGNLYLTEGIGEGDITLDNVVVKGEIIIKGGGASSIAINNSKINKVIIRKEESLVRVVFENTTVEEVKAVNKAKLELINGTTIDTVELDGEVEVSIDKEGTIVNFHAASKDIVINSNGNIKSLLATQEIKINDKNVKANVEFKVEEGKVSEVKETVDKPSSPSTGSSEDDYKEPTPRPEKPEKPEASVTLTSIKITSPADKLVYEIGEELDITGLQVTGVYSDGSEKTEKLKAEDISGFDSSKESGSQKLTITIDGKTVTYTIEIKAKEVEKPEQPVNYEFTAELDKEEYEVDEDIILLGSVLKDSMGLENVDLTLKLDDDTGSIITIDQIRTGSDGTFVYKFKVPAGTESGEYKLTLKASDPVSKTLELNLSIKEVEAPVTLTSIKITSPAEKLFYEIGDELDITGLEVTGTYSDGSKKVEEVTIEDNISGFDSSEAVASQELTITIDGKRVTYTIEIKTAEVEPVEEIYIRFGLGTSAEESIIEDNILGKVTMIKGEYFPKDSRDIWIVTEGLEDDEIDSIVITSSNENIIKITQRPAWEDKDPNRRRCFGKANNLGEAKIIATVTTKDGQVYIGELDVTVVSEEAPVTLTSIRITNPANKVVYEIGEKLDITGLEVTGVYSDGSEKLEEVTIEDISGFDSTKEVAIQELTITIDGKTVTYTIEIIANEVEPVEDIEITLEYFNGQDAYMTSYPSTVFELTDIVNAPENAVFYKVVIGDDISKMGKIDGYEAIWDISIEEFEALLESAGGVIVELYEDNSAEIKITEVQVPKEQLTYVEVSWW